MLSFIQFIVEEKNLHLTHAEDSIVDSGVVGTRKIINYFRAIRDMLSGNAAAPVNLTTKFDGAPSIFCGTDPSDGKFFVAKKGIFNKNPKVYKTDADVDADTSGDLNTKMKLALHEFSKMNVKGVIQGDFLYAREDLKKISVDGESYITFHPNTISYAVPENSEIARKILGSKLGVAWHTVYRGDSFETMRASFGEEIASKLKEVKSVWSIDAVFKDVSGNATFTKAETAHITSLLSAAGSLFTKIPAKALNDLGSDEVRRIRVNTFINSKIRVGEQIQSPAKFVEELLAYLDNYFQKEIDSKKSEKGKQANMQKRDEVMNYFKTTSKTDLVNIFKLYSLMIEIKMIIIKKLNKVDQLRTFLKTSKGYEVTGQEGFVAIDHMGKNAIKLVDRLQFSKANFSPDYIKGWTK